MALLKPAFEKLMILEGAYVVDHAGPTNWGVTLPVLKLLGDVDDDGAPDGDLNRDGTVNAKDVLLMDQDTAYKVVDTMRYLVSSQPVEESPIRFQTIMYFHPPHCCKAYWTGSIYQGAA